MLSMAAAACAEADDRRSFRGGTVAAAHTQAEPASTAQPTTTTTPSEVGETPTTAGLTPEAIAWIEAQANAREEQAAIDAYLTALAEARREEEERQRALEAYLAALAEQARQQDQQAVAAPPACDPNYDSCVPIASDVDCASGSGNGPAYVRGPVRVIGRDIYRLDNDGDGIGCERG
jgi:hypothetical protein